MAAAFDRKSVAEMAGIVAIEGRAKYNAYSVNGDRDIYKGLTFWSPNVNIFRDPRWGRGHETYGEDPYLTKNWEFLCKSTSGKWGYNEGSSLCQTFCSTFRAGGTPS